MLLSASKLFPRMLSSASANCSFDVTGILALQISPGSVPHRTGRQRGLQQLLAPPAPCPPQPVHEASGPPRQQSPPKTASRHVPNPTDSLLSGGFL